jgi:hypothetical protein
MDIEKNSGIQELYELKIKTTSNMTIGERIFTADETVLYFQNAEMSMMTEDVKLQKAFGGQFNSNLVLWRQLSNVNFGIDKGVLSDNDLALLMNAKIIEEASINVSKREDLVADSAGVISLKYTPAIGTKVFGYIEKENGFEKITGGIIDSKTIDFGMANAFAHFIVDYSFNCSGAKSYFIRNDKLPGIFRVEAKTRLKDDVDGKERTGIIVIPNMQLISSINFIMGSKATPIVGNFMFTSISTPNVDKKQSISMDNSVYATYILNDDIDSI